MQTLPKIENVLLKMKHKLAKLNEKIDEVIEPDEDIALRDEKHRLVNLLKEIQNQNCAFENEEIIDQTYSNFELEYFKMKKKVECKMNNHLLLATEDVENYNNASYKVNTFLSVMESTY